jgi:hypothetical protein
LGVLSWSVRRRPGRLVPFLAVAIAGCSASHPPPGTINVPPPLAAGDPSPLAVPQPSPDHVHAMLLLPDGGLLVATHTGLRLARHGATAKPTVGAVSGDVLGLAAGPGGALLLAGHNIGVQVSHDAGASWRVAAPEVAGLDVHGLATDPHDPTKAWIYVKDKGIMTSVDGGARWTHSPGWADTHYITGLCVTADGTLLAGSPDLGIAASTDHGSTFVAVNGSTGAIYSIAASAGDPDVVVAAAQDGIFLTQDGGKHWSNGVTAVTITAVMVDPSDPRRLFAGGGEGTVFVSADAAGSWSIF